MAVFRYFASYLFVILCFSLSETYRGVIVATSAIGALATMLVGIAIYYLVAAHGSLLL